MAKGTLNYTLYHEAAKASLGSDICLFCSHFIRQVATPHSKGQGSEILPCVWKTGRYLVSSANDCHAISGSDCEGELA